MCSLCWIYTIEGLLKRKVLLGYAIKVKCWLLATIFLLTFAPGYHVELLRKLSGFRSYCRLVTLLAESR